MTLLRQAPLRASSKPVENLRSFCFECQSTGSQTTKYFFLQISKLLACLKQKGLLAEGGISSTGIFIVVPPLKNNSSDFTSGFIRDLQFIRKIQNLAHFELLIHPIINTNLMLDVSCEQIANQPASSWLMLVVSPFRLPKLVIPHSKCDLISFLLLYRWKNTQFVRRCDSQSTSSGVFFPTWLRSVNKEADTPSVSETGLTCGARPHPDTDFEDQSYLIIRMV